MNRACITIPIYTLALTHYERISLLQCSRILSQHDIFFVLPFKLEKEISRHPDFQFPGIKKVAFPDFFFAGIEGYNKLLKYPGFYQAFSDYNYMLIYQLDAFVFSDQLAYWMNMEYDYIGAPLFEGHENAGQGSPIIGQGNGGFSLRKISSFLSVLRTTKKLNYVPRFTDRPGAMVSLFRFIKHRILFDFSRYPFQPFLNEDIFWFDLVPSSFSWFRVPDPMVSVGFSFEVNPRVLFEWNQHTLPFGCHAWWKYDLDFWRAPIRQFGYDI